MAVAAPTLALTDHSGRSFIIECLSQTGRRPSAAFGAPECRRTSADRGLPMIKQTDAA
jgi:hypothetical protein